MAKIPKGLRLEQDTVKEIQKIAKREKRTFNKVVDIALDEYVERNKNNNPPHKTKKK